MPDPAPPTVSWTVVLPVQQAERAKTRLHLPASSAAGRPELARALALDSLDAVRGCASVRRRVVVTSDAVVAARCTELGDEVRPDPGAGLGAALAVGVAHATAEDPAQAVAVLLPDVPALRAQDLDAALAAAGQHPFALVPDAEGTGTVLLCGRPGSRLRLAFGPGSADRHRGLGAVALAVDLPRLRRDVDTWPALQEASVLGVGPATRAVLGARRTG